jgi:two-component system, chemotaxis family, protein-glutamate methylesterase/glutaminase
MQIPATGTPQVPKASADEAVYRVMLVDDSIVIRGLISRALESDQGIKVIQSVGDGEVAVRTLKRSAVDVIVLDIEMPVMDGMAAIPLLLEVDPAVKIIMASTLTLKNAEISMKALELGAADYIPKPLSSKELTGADNFKRELVEKVKALGAFARRSGVRMDEAATVAPPAFRASHAPTEVKKDTRVEFKTATPPKANPIHAAMATGAGKNNFTLRQHQIIKPEIIAIGSSTGGPQALFRVIKDLGKDINQPIVLTQHMPPTFTTILADHISKQGGLLCHEAKDGETLEPGVITVAPGDYHMTIERAGVGKNIVRLNQNPPENFCRPAVDPMLRSLIPLYGNKIFTIILTGMGQDGWKGSEDVVKAGGSVIAQDETTSVVWGMPGSVAMAGICSSVLPLNEIGGAIRRVATGGKL